MIQNLVSLAVLIPPDSAMIQDPLLPSSEAETARPSARPCPAVAGGHSSGRTKASTQAAQSVSSVGGVSYGKERGIL